MYETKEDALETVRYIKEEYGTVLKVYKCPVCGKYHLTEGR